jgi:hypothetical protein
MDKQKFLAILDKNINQEQLAIDLGVEFIKPWLEAQKAKVVAGEIDLIAGTDLDNQIMAKSLDALLAKLV